MPLIRFTPTLQRHVACSEMQVDGASVNAALGQAFTTVPTLRSYLVDEQGALRKHVTVFVDGWPIRDRTRLSDALEPGSEIDVMQALSGG
jgi:molybdopterin synthase sulfur carrier subunit